MKPSKMLEHAIEQPCPLEGFFLDSCSFKYREEQTDKVDRVVRGIKNGHDVWDDQTWGQNTVGKLEKQVETTTPLAERDRVVLPEDRVRRIIDDASRDASLPFKEDLIADLNYLLEPDPMDEGIPFSPEALQLFLDFMRRADWLNEPPRLTAGVNGGLCAGWQRSKSHYLFVYFMRIGDIQYIVKHPDAAYQSDRLASSLDREQKMAPLSAAFKLFCSGGAHAS
ncbi:MAG: hypothetical protein HQL98_06150 [Magnetococcales bacterium]|nr:hypothetical protein [Magnetococcales bacterium]